MVDAGVDVDAASVESSLESTLDVEVVDVELLHDGLNRSLAVSTPGEERAYVLRRPNELRDTGSFVDLSTEYAVLDRLRATPVPAPEPVCVCEDASVLGDPFLVTTYLDGEVVPLGEDLPARFRTPAARERLATELVGTLADLHTVDVDRFADICARRTPRDQVAEVADRIDGATRVTGHDPPALREAVDWLRRHVPADREAALVHGDYRPGNVLFGGDDRPTVTGVLDWETPFLGDPRTELGYLLLRWRDAGDPTVSLDDLALDREEVTDEDVRWLRACNERGLAPFTGDPGSPTRRELVARYEDATGIEFAHDRFYRALGAVTLASVWADLHRLRVEAGDDPAPSTDPRVEYLALVADRIIGGELVL